MQRGEIEWGYFFFTLNLFEGFIPGEGELRYMCTYVHTRYTRVEAKGQTEMSFLHRCGSTLLLETGISLWGRGWRGGGGCALVSKPQSSACLYLPQLELEVHAATPDVLLGF